MQNKCNERQAVKTKARKPPLSYRLKQAVKCGDLRGVRKALDDGADPNKTLKDYLLGNVTPLYIAVWKMDTHALSRNMLKIIKELIERGADVDLPIASYMNGSIVHLAANFGFTELVESLIVTYKGNPNLLNENGRSPLYFAAIHEHAATARRLMECGADPFYIDPLEQKTAAQILLGFVFQSGESSPASEWLSEQEPVYCMQEYFRHHACKSLPRWEPS